MGVLAERENAEEVGYSVVGEEAKPAENEVPYNIREEQTIDKSSVFTANNDTTTGMATVIPGVNAPKLIASTSIYGDLGGGGGDEPTVGSVKFTVEAALRYPDDMNKDFKTFTLSEAWGDEIYTNSADGLVCPSGGWYQLDVTFPNGGSTFCADTIIKTGSGDTIYTDTGTYNSTVHTSTIRFKIDAGGTIYINCQLHYTGSAGSFGYYGRDFSAVITKL